MNTFISSRHFRRDYDRTFRKDPLAANIMLLLCEFADKNGYILIDSPFPEVEIQRLMTARFEDPRAYQLPGGPRR